MRKPRSERSRWVQIFYLTEHKGKFISNVYADLSPDFKRAAVEKLAGAFNLPLAGESVTASVTETRVAT